MTDRVPETEDRLTRANRHFAEAVCRIVGESREQGQIDPEMLALEIDFALRGCFVSIDGGYDEALQERRVALLELAGGPTRHEVVHNTAKPSGGMNAASLSRLPFG